MTSGSVAAVIRLSSMNALARVATILLLGVSPALAQAPAATSAGAHDHEPASAEALGYVEGASALEGRLLAPCCWNQTLDMHGSEPANELKREIRRRLAAGETAAAIEEDIVARYGEKIRAVPTGSPLKSTAVLLTLLMGAAGVGALFLLLRWRRRSALPQAPEPGEEKGSQRDEYDERIDAELDRM